jgi:hypothetical protein
MLEGKAKPPSEGIRSKRRRRGGGEVRGAVAKPSDAAAQAPLRTAERRLWRDSTVRDGWSLPFADVSLGQMRS